MQNMIKNVIFDIGGVLVNFDPERVFRNMGLPEEEIQILLKNTALSSLWTELDRGIIDKDTVFSEMRKNIPEIYHKDADRFFKEEVLKTVFPFDYSPDWMNGLKKRGYKIYLLTNYPEWMFDDHFKTTFNFSHLIDGKVVSGKVKKIKPDPEIYKCLLEKYSLTPDECVFIDDRLENVQGAIKMGIHGIQFTTYSDTVSSLESLLSE